MNISPSNTKEFNIQSSSIGGICSATCKLENCWIEAVMAMIYISLNQKICIIVFLKSIGRV